MKAVARTEYGPPDVVRIEDASQLLPRTSTQRASGQRWSAEHRRPPAIRRNWREWSDSEAAQEFRSITRPFIPLELDNVRLASLAESRIRGPRLFFSGPAFTAPGGFPIPVICQGSEYCADNATVQVTDPQGARGEVRRLAEAGVDGIKVMLDPSIPLDSVVIAAVIDETRGLGLHSMLHAHRVEDMLMGARLGGARLVHTPSDILIASGPDARILREKGIAISTTVSLTAPQFAEATGAAYGSAARHQVLLENIRHLVDEGVVVAFGTDSPPFLRPMVEIEQLSKVLAPEEVIPTLTRNAAAFLDQLDQIGTRSPCSSLGKGSSTCRGWMFESASATPRPSRSDSSPGTPFSM